MSADPARPQLGELLVQKGVLTEAQLEHALAEQRNSGAPLGEILVRLGYSQAPTIANALADQHGGPLRTEYGLSMGPTPSGPVPVPVRHDSPEQDTAIMRLRSALDEKTEELARVYAELVQVRQELEAHRPAPVAPDDRHLLFVPGSEGYTMVERAGPPPEAGTVIQHGAAAFTVRKVGECILLGVPIRCALVAHASSAA
jgi:hypothetical protein